MMEIFRRWRLATLEAKLAAEVVRKECLDANPNPYCYQAVYRNSERLVRLRYGVALYARLTAKVPKARLLND